MASLQVKLEIAQKLLAATFTKVKSPQMLAGIYRSAVDQETDHQFHVRKR
jgi:hypothetical protein